MLIVPVLKLKYGGEDMKLDSGSLLEAVISRSVEFGTLFSIRASLRWTTKWDRVIRNEERKSGELRLQYHSPDFVLKDEPIQVRFNIPSLGIENEFLHLTLKGTDLGHHNLQKSRYKAYKDKTVSDIVKSIADKHDLDDDEIEATKDKTDLYQCGCSDRFFINNFLLPYAITSSGRADFYCFVRNGSSLVFRPPDYEQEPKKALSYASTDRYGRTDEVAIEECKVSYHPLEIARKGSFSSKILGFDPFQKKTVEFDQNDNTIELPQPAGASIKPTISDDAYTLYITGVMSEDQDFASSVERYGKIAWTRRSNGLFKLDVATGPLMGLKLLDTVRLNFNVTGDKKHFVAGNYLLVGIDHKIVSGRMGTVLHLERRYHA